MTKATKKAEPQEPAAEKKRPNGKALALRKANEVATQDMRDYMERVVAAAAVAKGLDPSRVVKSALMEIASRPELQKCSLESLGMAVSQAATVGLICNGFLGEAAMVPRWNKHKKVTEAHFQPMFRGKIALAKRSGEVKKIEARVVREGDYFRFQLGLNPILEHVPAEGGEDDESRELTHAYAIAWLTNGETTFDVLDRSTVSKIKAASPQAEGELWTKWEPEAWRKTAVHRLGKYLDLSPEARAAWAIDGVVESGGTVRDVSAYGGVEVDEGAGNRPKDRSATSATRERMKDLRGRMDDSEGEPEQQEAIVEEDEADAEREREEAEAEAEAAAEADAEAAARDAEEEDAEARVAHDAEEPEGPPPHDDADEAGQGRMPV